MDRGPYLNFSFVKSVDAAKFGLEVIAQLENFFSSADITFTGIGGFQPIGTADKQFGF